MTITAPCETVTAYVARTQAAERRRAAQLAGALRYYTAELAALTTTTTTRRYPPWRVFADMRCGAHLGLYGHEGACDGQEDKRDTTPDDRTGR